MLVSAGFDSHRDDPIGSLELETEDFIELTRIVLNVAAGTHVVSRRGAFRWVRATARDTAENRSPMARARVTH